MRSGIIYDPVYLKHDTGLHVENGKRLEAIISRLEQSGLMSRLVHIQPRAATIKEISLVHTQEHISHIQEISSCGGGCLDADTLMSPGSYEAAIYAVGGTIKATEAVISGIVDNAFALVRPPGHHATPQAAMGFCLFNNIAIAARYALVNYNLKRIAIIDFDVHHGNGTQETFYSDPRVLYISTHQYPFYPGTGSYQETGTGKAVGTKINIPLPAGCGDAEYAQVFDNLIVPAVTRFQPQLILVSAGYDSHWADEIGMMKVSVSGFARIIGTIKTLAEEYCKGRVVLGLEGGYNISALAESVKATFAVLLGSSNIQDSLGLPNYILELPDISSVIMKIKEIHHLS